MENPPNGTVQWRLAQLEKRVEEIEHRFDRLLMAVIVGCVTLVVSTILHFL